MVCDLWGCASTPNADMKSDSESKSIDTAHAEIYTICIPGFDAKSSQVALQSHIANDGDYLVLP